jgi:serine/threonine protein kinase
VNTPPVEPLKEPAPPVDPHVTTDGSGTDRAESDLGFLLPGARPDSLGRLGHYEILEVLGRGGFGIVLRAFDDVLQRLVAIKVLSPQMAGTSPARKRFLREARAAAQVRHENVVQIYAVEEQPLPYLVMEFIPGETLQQRLDRTGPFEAAQVADIGRQIAEGLAAAHAAGLIHRDVKPANILIEPGPRLRLKITDFGLARAADDASLTQSGLVAGTPLYMSPEQARGETLDHRTDLFSLGSVLYAIVSGRPPFRAENQLAILKRVAEDAPRPIPEVIPETLQELCRIIEKLHAKDPADRFPSARAVAEVLGDCEQQLQAHRRPRDPSHIPARERQQRPRWGRWAAAVALFALLGLSVALWRGWVNGLFAPHSPVRSSPPPLATAPFDAAMAKHHQETWARHLGAPVEFTNSIGMKFRLIPPGTYTMGTSSEEIATILPQVPEWAWDRVRSEAPPRLVQIPAPFYLATTEVTVGQFKQFVAAVGYKTVAETNGQGGGMWTGMKNETRPEFTWRYQEAARSDSHPVDQLCPLDALAFCRWLRGVDGLEYDLPDEERWEYACRAGTVTPWSCGSERAELDRHGLAGWNLAFRGRPVGERPANPFGLFDLLGNCTELCRRGDGGYVGRGPGGFDIWLARSAHRIPLTKETHCWQAYGFRVAVLGDLTKVAEVGARPPAISPPVASRSTHGGRRKDPAPLNPLLGFRPFTDGSSRPVYLDQAPGEQYVLDDQGEPLYGHWLCDTEPDTPAVVLAEV